MAQIFQYLVTEKLCSANGLVVYSASHRENGQACFLVEWTPDPANHDAARKVFGDLTRARVIQGFASNQKLYLVVPDQDDIGSAIQQLRTHGLFGSFKDGLPRLSGPPRPSDIPSPASDTLPAREQTSPPPGAPGEEFSPAPAPASTPKVEPSNGNSPNADNLKKGSPAWKSYWRVLGGVLFLVAVGVFVLPLRERTPRGSVPDPHVTPGPTPRICELKPPRGPDVATLLQYLNRGLRYAAQKKPDLALSAFQEIEKIDPNFLGGQLNIGSAYLAQRKFTEAADAFAKELHLIACLKSFNEQQLAPFAYMMEVEPSTQPEKGNAQAKLFRSRLAKAEATVHYDLACLHSLQNQKEPAIEELKKALAGGAIDRKLLETDADLRGIRSTKEFRTIFNDYTGNEKQ